MIILVFGEVLGVWRGEVSDLLLRHRHGHVHPDAAEHVVDPGSCSHHQAATLEGALRRVNLRNRSERSETQLRFSVTGKQVLSCSL